MDLKLRAWRMYRAVSQTELAERAGLSKPSIVALEKPNHRTPHPRTVRQIAKALDIAPHELYQDPPTLGEA